MHVSMAIMPVTNEYASRTAVMTISAAIIWATVITATAEAEIDADAGFGVGGGDGGGAGGDCERGNGSQKDFLKH